MTEAIFDKKEIRKRVTKEVDRLVKSHGEQKIREIIRVSKSSLKKITKDYSMALYVLFKFNENSSGLMPYKIVWNNEGKVDDLLVSDLFYIGRGALAELLRMRRYWTLRKVNLFRKSERLKLKGGSRIITAKDCFILLCKTRSPKRLSLGIMLKKED